MKKLFGILVVLASILIVTGCGSSPSSSSPRRGRLAGVPSFVISPPQAEDVIYGVGAADYDDVNLAITMAENRARVSIARELDSRVKSMIDDMTQAAGASREDSLSFAQTVSRTLTEARLSGARRVETGEGDDGTIYVLVSMKKADASKYASDIINKEKIRYAAFENWNAQRELDAALDKYKYDGENPPIVDEGE
ncbi:MAG: LPP20 family lipoprotein [Spirochaetaceae bacterium]|nr:LPP20 family lipoprotein [Spirochaetaceae bacterium]